MVVYMTYNVKEFFLAIFGTCLKIGYLKVLVVYGGPLGVCFWEGLRVRGEGEGTEGGAVRRRPYMWIYVVATEKK